MKEDAKRQNLVSVLSTDLWANTLSRLDPCEGKPVCLREAEEGRQSRLQAEYYALQTVCQTFNQVFKDRPQLICSVVLKAAFDSQKLPSLLLWLRKHASTIQVFACYRPCAEAALSTLFCHAPVLQAISMYECSSSAMSLLPSFTSLTTIELLSSCIFPLDLTPLHSLSRLQKMELHEGYLNSTGMPPHLTSFYLKQSTIHICHDMSFVTALRHLDVTDGDVRVERIRLSAFQALRLLRCSDSLIALTDSEEESDTIELSYNCFTELPNCLLMLTSLTELHLKFGGTSGNYEFDLRPVYQLTALCSLAVATTDKGIIVSEEMTKMEMLTSLQLSACSGPVEGPVCLLTYVDWAAMQRLQHLRFESDFVIFTSLILGLPKLQSLKTLFLCKCRPASDDSQVHFAQLIVALNNKRPDIHLSQS